MKELAGGRAFVSGQAGQAWCERGWGTPFTSLTPPPSLLPVEQGAPLPGACVNLAPPPP